MSGLTFSIVFALFPLRINNRAPNRCGAHAGILERIACVCSSMCYTQLLSREKVGFHLISTSSGSRLRSQVIGSITAARPQSIFTTFRLLMYPPTNRGDFVNPWCFVGETSLTPFPSGSLQIMRTRSLGAPTSPSASVQMNSRKCHW